MIECSIIILSYNQCEYTKKCLESIRKYTNDVNYEIIIVDNASDSDTLKYLESQIDVTLVKNQNNMGFAGGCNQGIAISTGKYVLLLNNDTIVTEKWLFNMVKLLDENQDIDMTGPLTNATVGKQMIKVPYDNDLSEMQKFAMTISTKEEKPWKTLRLVAFCVLIRRDVINEIGMLDTEFLVGNYEDDDFNIRALLAGKKACICRKSFIHHFMNVSFKQKNIQREKIMMRNKVLLEDKWDNLNWNHYAVYSDYMMKKILQHGGKRILHLGCGMAALEVELKDRLDDYYIVGTDSHFLRLKIAQNFLDEVIPFDKHNIFSDASSKYDIIIVEEMVERFGMDMLENIWKMLKPDGMLLVRIFNYAHITSIERLLTGTVQGRLLCATSEEFRYYYNTSLLIDFQKYGFLLEERQDVRKSFSNLQECIYSQVKPFLGDDVNPYIYNSIFILKRK